MTRDYDENAATALGALMRTPATNDDEQWLAKNQKSLMMAIGGQSAPRASTFPLFREAETLGHRRSLNARGWTAVIAVAAGSLLALGWSLGDDGPSLTFTVAGETGETSAPQELGRVRAPETESRTLQFSDGSTLKLAQGGSVRVRETDEHGAEVVIENGQLESTVMHLDEASWSVFAGPYEIEVIGTKFSTQWDAATQRLVVLLDEGSVRVVGSDIEDHVALKPGQRFEAAPQQSWKVTAQQPEVAHHAPEEVETDAGVQPPEEEVNTLADLEESESDRAPVVPTSRPGAAPSWPELLRSGKNREILSQAKSRGLASCLSNCSVDNLRALADAARYTGEITIARDALTRLRSRSPGESARAGYLLGSLSEARGQAAAAVTWYDTYLREAPGGSFAAEARAGRMRALHALGRHDDAQAAANEYLRRYPSGTSAATARRILNRK